MGTLSIVQNRAENIVKGALSVLLKVEHPLLKQAIKLWLTTRTS